MKSSKERVNAGVMQVRRRQVLYDKKWRRFLARSWPWRFVPFVEFVLAAGSMALGNVHKDSDFDVIVGVRSGRIFTARACAVAIFGLLGWRRKKLAHDETASDRICLNHFVTESRYRLSPPHNAYWQELYRNLVPIYGAVDAVNGFWDANRDWMGDVPRYADDLRHRHRTLSFLKRGLERMFSRGLGDWLERRLKDIQVRLIEQSLSVGERGYNPRILYGDFELEFHPDTRRIERYLEERKRGLQ